MDGEADRTEDLFRSKEHQEQREDGDDRKRGGGYLRLADVLVETAVGTITIFFLAMVMMVDEAFRRNHQGEKHHEEQGKDLQPIFRTHHSSSSFETGRMITSSLKGCQGAGPGPKALLGGGK